MLLLEEASKADQFSKLLQDERAANRMFASLKKNYGFECAIKKLDTEQYTSNMIIQAKEYIHKEFPNLRFVESSEDCRVSIWEVGGKSQLTQEKGKLLSVEAVYEDSAETKMRKAEIAMAQAAASRAAERAQQARWNAAGEAAQDIFKKMYDGRVRLEQWGGKTMMVHGSGNWAGQASIASQTALHQANAQADSLNAKLQNMSSSPAGQVQMGENKTYQTSTTFSNTAQGFMTANIYGRKFQKDGAVADGTNIKVCDTKEYKGGVFKEATNCRFMRSSSFNYDTYYRDNFAVAFTQNLKLGRIDKMMNLANKLIKSTKAEDRLEGYFLKQMYSSENHQANLLKEGQAVLGRSVNKDEMRTLSFAKWSM